MAYDPIDQETIYFGGCISSECPNNQTWAFLNGAWTNITNRYDAPPARYAAVMDYDANMRGLLLFGGYGASGYLNDTWLFAGGSWTDLTLFSPTAPSARGYAAMAFDPALEENGSVLFGGFGPPSFTQLNDTWVWQGGSGWVRLDTSFAPPPPVDPEVAYDPADGAIVYPGCSIYCSVPKATWELYAGQWWEVLPPGPIPPYRIAAVETYDAALSAIVLFGGEGATQLLNDTWAFSNGRWTNLTASVGPAPEVRRLAGLSPDSSSFPPVLFGGLNTLSGSPSLNDTWVLEVPPSAGLSATPSSTETNVPVTFTASVTGGTPPYRATFHFGDGLVLNATSSTTTVTTTETYSVPGSYTASVNVTDAAGARVTASALSSVHVLNGPSLGPLSEPTSGDAGIALSFTGGAVTNGSAPYTFAWQFGDGGSASGINASHAYAAAGTYTGNLTVTDHLGGTSAGSFTVVVHPVPTVTIANSPGSPLAGADVTFYGNASGGTPPYHFAWKFSDGVTSAVPYPVLNFSVAGGYSVQLWVNDSVGGSAHSSTSFTVGSASPPTTLLGSVTGAPIWFWPAVGGLAAVGVIGAVLLLRRPR